MKKNMIAVLSLCKDDKSKEICLNTLQNWFDWRNIPIPFTENAYFTDEVLLLNDDEVFVDVGAFDGDTIEQFLIQTKGEFNHIHALEMNPITCLELKNKILSYNENIKSKITVYPLGAWDKSEFVGFDLKSSDSVVVDCGAEAELVPLDHVLEDVAVTLIKMDIEGAEMKALKGAENIIKKNLPKLAICTYHKAEHLWEIPFYIKSLSTKYKIYFRHHDTFEHGTICYAIAK